jgi:homoserine dehydrogenase
MKRMNIGLLGIGTVGGGVFELLKQTLKKYNVRHLLI